jgi:hypothetical protein
VTDRDREIVAWIARTGAVTIGNLMARFRIGRSVAFDRVAVCTRAGHLARTHTLYGAPALITATRRGLRYAGLEELGIVVPTEGHDRRLRARADVALWLERTRPGARVMSARELRAEERALGRPIASQTLDEDYEGRPRFHRPDFAVLGKGRTEAVEVELVPRLPDRLEMLIRHWRWTEIVDTLTLVCAPGRTTRYAHRTLERIGYQELVREGWVRVVCLDQIPNLARQTRFPGIHPPTADPAPSPEQGGRAGGGPLDDHDSATAAGNGRPSENATSGFDAWPNEE